MSDPLEARRALKTLTDAVSELEKQVAYLVVRERELEGLTEGLAEKDAKARANLAAAEQCCSEMSERNKELEPQVRELTRRVQEETKRAEVATAHAEGISAKALRYDRLLTLSRSLLEAFDRLPMKQSDAHVIPSDSRPEIELYGTYEWKAVADAQLALQRLVGDQ